MKLREIRERKNITQKELCKQLDLRPTTYNGYEKGLAEPNLTVLKKLADFYKVTIDELVGHEVPYLIDKSLLSQKQIELIDIVKTMNDEECNFLIAYSLGIKKGIEERISKFNKRG